MPIVNTSFRLWLRPTGSSEVSKAPRPDSDSSARHSFPKCKGRAFRELWRNRGMDSSCYILFSLTLDEIQQVLVHFIFLGGTHAVRPAFVNLEVRVLDEFR